MSDDLLPYEQSTNNADSPSDYDLIAQKFYEWEKRGRGWQVHNDVVDLEPPFRPFYYLECEPTLTQDDGHIPTFFSDLVQIFKKDEEPTRVRQEFSKARREYWDRRAALDDAAFCSYQNKIFAELQVLLPRELKITGGMAEQLLLSLSYTSGPVSFEVIGDAENTIVQYSATTDDIGHLRRQLQARLPETSFRQTRLDEDYLTAKWLNGGKASRIIDFGLSNAFFLPLNTKTGGTDPLVTIIGALSDLRVDEIGIFQVLFQKARCEWQQEITQLLDIFEDSGLFDGKPDIRGLVNQKLGPPLYAAVVRTAARGSDDDNALQIIRNMAGGLASFSKPAGNEFIPLSNDGYHAPYHEQAFLNRQSFRNGMLLNLEELSYLIGPPSQSVRSEKLMRESQRTKPLPRAAMNNCLILGENHHHDQAELVSLSSDQRTRHIHLIGSSGSGKSTLLLNLIKQDLEAGEGLCVIDPHGDLIDEIIANVPEWRAKDVVLFDPSDSEYPIGFNILQANSEIEKTILASDLTATFRRMSTSWGDVMDSVLANAVLAFVENTRRGTLLDLKRFLIEKTFRREFLESVTDEGIRYYWEKEFPMLTSKPQASILIRLDTFLRQKLIRNIVCQPETKLNFRHLMDNRQVLLIKLSQGLIDEENAYLLGTLLVSKLYQGALTRQETDVRPYFWLYLDEFHHFITPSMEGILSGARKYNLGLVLAHQEFRQLQSRNQEVASSVLSNCYTRVCFRLGDADADKLSSGFSFFDAGALQNLGIGEAIARIERAEFDFNLKTRFLEPVASDLAEQKRAQIVAPTRANFARPKADVEAELQISRSAPTSPPSADLLEERPRSTQKVPKERTVPFDSLKEPETEAVIKYPQKKLEKPPSDRGMYQHKYLQALVKRIAEQKGFRCTIEKQVFGGIGNIDIALENGKEKIACEISVTNQPDYEVQNLEKCLSAGFVPAIMISPEAKHLEKIQQLASSLLSDEQYSKILFLSPDEFYAWINEHPQPVSEGETVKGFKVNLKMRRGDSSDQSTRKRAITDVILGALKRSRDKE